jgi:5-methylcytosine-specific restriction endonuclease McrA
MPIKDKSLYPPDWKQIRQRILERDGHRCKHCGVENYAVGARTVDGEWMDERSINNLNSSEGEALFGHFPKIIKIVLTIAHLNHDPTDNRDENLSALCQKCHLNHDKDQHKENARKTRNKKKGLQELF